MLKYISILAILFLTLVSVNAQVDRTKAPKPGPAPEIKIGDYKSFVLPNGLKVFVIENHRLPLVSYSISFYSNPVLEKEFSGYSQFTGELLGTGTKNRTKDQINEEIDFLGASLTTSSGGLSASSLKKHTSKLLDVVSDVLLNAVFNKEELEKIRTKTLSAIASNKNDPEAIASDVKAALFYGIDHPYGEIITEATAKNITLEKCQEYYSTYFRPNVAYLSIVGDITLEEAKPLVEKYFGKWMKKEVPGNVYPKPQPPAKTRVAIVDRPESVQSVINIGYAVDLTLSNPDYIKARVANVILGGPNLRLYNNLREKHGYTYGAYSSFTSMPLVGSFTASANVRNAVTDSAITQILYEMKRMRNEQVPAEELSRVKNYMTGNFALSLESPQTIASFAVNTDRYKLAKDFYKNYLKNLSMVTSADIQAVSGKYILPDHSTILVVGKASEVADKIKSLGSSLTYYTEEAVAYDPASKAKAVPEGLTAQQVLDTYIKAVGGVDKIASVKDVTMKGSISVQGMQISIEITQKLPDKSLTVVKMGTNELNKTVLNGNRAVSTNMGNSQEITGGDLEMQKMQAMIFPENQFDKIGFKAVLKGVEQINGNDAYIIEETSPSGSVATDYFDAKSGLRVKTLTLQDSPNGKIAQETVVLGYTEINGVKFPNKLKQTMGPQSFEISIDSINVNTSPSDDLFKL